MKRRRTKKPKAKADAAMLLRTLHDQVEDIMRNIAANPSDFVSPQRLTKTKLDAWTDIEFRIRLSVNQLPPIQRMGEFKLGDKICTKKQPDLAYKITEFPSIGMVKGRCLIRMIGIGDTIKISIEHIKKYKKRK